MTTGLKWPYLYLMLEAIALPTFPLPKDETVSFPPT